MGSAERLVQLSADAAFAVDKSLRVIAWNSAAERLMGYTHEEVIGQPCYKVVAATTKDAKPICSPECAGLVCLRQGCPYRVGPALCRTKAGTRVVATLSSLLLPEELRQEDALALVFIHPLENVPEYSQATQVLQIYTLGRFAVYRGGSEVPPNAWGRRQSLTLLKYLVTHRGRPVHRELLMDMLWPEVPVQVGQERLKVLVYALRKGLIDDGVQDRRYLVTDGDCYVLSRGSVWVDVDSYEALYQRGHQLEREGEAGRAIATYTQAKSMYQGDYMGAELYADWCALERERLKELHLTVLQRLAHLHATSGQYDEAASSCREALGHDPCRESVHRDLMGYLWRAGRPSEALHQYRLCCQVLHQQLGIDPMPETQHLYQRILERRPV